MNKRIVLLFVLGLLLCNVYNVVATPTTSLSDMAPEMLVFIIWFGYCALLCFIVRYVIPCFDFLKDNPISLIIGILIAGLIAFFMKLEMGMSSHAVEGLFVMMVVSAIFIMILGDIVLVPEEEKN